MTLNFNAFLAIIRYYEGANGPLHRLESEPFDALLTSVRINPCFPMPVAQEIVRRWNAHPKLLAFLRALRTEGANQILHEIEGGQSVYAPEEGGTLDPNEIAQSWQPTFPDALPGPYRETLHRLHRGGYYVELVGHWPGARPRIEKVSAEEAAHWLWRTGHSVPEDLRRFEGEVDE
jgi:hypothetical protein